MAETLPINFPIPSEAMVTYNPIDASLGVGYATYYGSAGTSGTFLTPITFDSDTSYTQFTLAQASGHTTAALRIDKDFDVDFKFPQEVEGKAIVQTSYRMKGTGGGSWGGGRTVYAKVNVYVYKVDLASAETLLISDVSTSYKSQIAEDDDAYRNCFDLTVPRTSFSVGEKLRITVQVWGYTTNHGGETVWLYLYHDGSNRLTTVVGDGVFTDHDTNLIIQIPFRINL